MIFSQDFGLIFLLCFFFQEMVGYGAGSVFASIFSGYITAASVARSSVQESAGGKTQV